MLKRIEMYLNWDGIEYYTNTEHEQDCVTKFSTLYNIAKAARDECEDASPANIDKWRKAYKGTLNALNKDGTESKRQSRSLRKMVYEFIESKIDNSIPMPKMMPRYKSDIPLVGVTEDYLKFESDRILTKYENDKNERSTYIDGTSWYKIGWNSLNNTHERSGDITIETRSVEQIVPQPGISNYKQLEYIFELEETTTSRIWDLYKRKIIPQEGTNRVKIVNCYYLNDNRIVGLFSWSPESMQVICNEEDWQIRKIRVCKSCGTINPEGTICRLCGNKTFKYENAEEEILQEDLMEIYNPYDVGEIDDENRQNEYKSRVFLSKGTTIPFYRIDQLPFVPRPAISSLDSIYGVSEVKALLEMQDAANKTLTKAFDKTMKSGAVITKPQKLNIGDTDETFKTIGVRSAEEAQMVQAKQIMADTTQDVVLANLMYESGRASSGVTESYQGASDSTAVSGKAKQFAAAQSAGRIESLRVMKAAAFAGVYELVFKYLLAFSDEERRFVKTLPDGNQKEECWNKYMFLAKDKYGQIYYRDDFTFNGDPSSTLTQNRASMWQETTDKFISGAFGTPTDPRNLELYWNMMAELQYPLAKQVLAGIKDNSQHLPVEVEQFIMQNPELQQIIAQTMQSQEETRGGARENSGPDGNGFTHSANVEKTNQANRAENRDVAFSAQTAGQEGTK